MKGMRELFPGRGLLIGLGVLVALAILVTAYQPLLPLWQVGGALLLALALADMVLLRAQPRLQLVREVSPNLSLGARQEVVLKLRNPGRQRQRLELHDHHPADFHVEGMPASLQLDGGEQARISYRITPRARGDHRFEQTALRVQSPLGLWQRRLRIDNPGQVRVFPNFSEMVHFTLLARRNQLSSAGVRRRQRRGQGSDFHQLRGYREGDSLRQIDWKATGRYRKLISREYQDEQNQQLFFLLDCGQRMRHRDESGEHLDAALNAMLLAAHVAVHQGDAVGYMTFAGSERYLPPRKGADSLPVMLRSAYDVHSSARAADYLRMADQFMAKHLRRALVVLITNTRDGDQSDLMLAVRLLQKRHLVIVADMREPLLDTGLNEPVRDRDTALRFHTTLALRTARERVHDAMRHQGAVVIDIRPEQLPLALVNEYFEIKRAARL